MAFQNIRRPYPEVDHMTIDKERGVILRHIYQGEGLNSQGYIEMVFETPGGNLEFDAYMKGGQKDKDGISQLTWLIRAARWVPPKANISEIEIKHLIKEAMETYGFLFEKMSNQNITVEFETKQVKGLSAWH